MKKLLSHLLAGVVGASVTWVCLSGTSERPDAHPKEVTVAQPLPPNGDGKTIRLRVISVAYKDRPLEEQVEMAVPKTNYLWRVTFPTHTLFVEPVTD
jgi:hypothetical protein